MRRRLSIIILLLSRTGFSLSLEDLERMALAKHPALAQASAAIRAAGARTVQSGLYPNPSIGVTADEVAGGPVIRGGEWGGFVEQRIVTSGKLGLARRMARESEREAAHDAEATRLRVLNEVRMLYYQALADEKRLAVREELAKIARRAVEISRELANVGQADRPDLLAVDIEAQRAELSLAAARHARDRNWRQLAAAVNHPDLKP
ncbi:MAG: TolC family protein, partial [Bryobacteraceae bacterium]